MSWVQLMVDATKAAKVKRFVNLQTTLCYGRPSKVPILLMLRQHHLQAMVFQRRVRHTSLCLNELRILRLANVTGPRLSIGPIPTFYTRLKEGKSCFCSDTA